MGSSKKNKKRRSRTPEVPPATTHKRSDVCSRYVDSTALSDDPVDPLRPPVKVRIWSSACGKWRYLSEDHAWEDIRAQHERKRTSKPNKSVPHHVYQCPVCGGFHMTSKTQRKPYPGERKVKSA